jgi:quercetin dioxygenase-like cupin family protein
MRFPSVLSGVLLMAFAATTSRAQNPAASPSPLKRVVVMQRQSTIPGHDGVVVQAELAPNSDAPRHTHPGEEYGYVLAGEVTFDIQGQPPLTLKAGDAFYVPPNTPHVAHNRGSVPWKAVSTYIVETGKPLATPAP